MRIIYDGQIFLNQAYGGINTYFTHLMSRFSQNFEADLLISPNNRASFPQLARVEIDTIQQSAVWPKTVGKWLDNRNYKKQIRRKNGDIFHPTYYNLLTEVPLGDIQIPVVVSVWDMIHEIYPQYYDPTGEKRAVKKQAILAADMLFCISETTKNDLMSYYDVSESKIKVILLAPGISAPNVVCRDNDSETPYFLYVGGRKFHKNFDGLIEAFRRVSTLNPDVLLKVVGRPFGQSELEHLRSLGVLERVDNLGDVGDARLAKLYQKSLALVYPSFYEGFGIPPLEAMACGTVAIVSNQSCLPEIAGEGALFFDPDLSDDLEDKMLAVLNNSTLRTSYIEKGRKWVEQYSWDNTANQIFDVYLSMVEIG